MPVKDATESPACRVCGSTTEAIYRSNREYGLTSSASIIKTQTIVDACRTCGHAQTRPLDDLFHYYSSQYNFRTQSPEEDDLCGNGSGVVFRSELQADIVGRLVDLSRPLDVLDYGCGKARTLEILSKRYPSIRPYVFDVSESYREYWNGFVAPEHQATFELPAEWNKHFDLVLSFFALEHVGGPAAFVTQLRSLLTETGRAIVVMPNVYQNFGDLIVVDHINHFSERSLGRLFERDFGSVRVDTGAQVGWHVVEAAPASGGVVREADPVQAPDRIAAFWQNLERRVADAESRAGKRKAAIYGSGIFGLAIAGSLRRSESIACFLDRNPFRQGLEFFGAPVIAPDALPEDVDMVYVGLNPEYAREAIDAVPGLKRNGREFFFI